MTQTREKSTSKLVVFQDLSEEEKAQSIKTRLRKRSIRSVSLGEFELHFRQGTNAQAEEVLPEGLAALLPKSKNYSYESIWEVTRMRFFELQQRQDIQDNLSIYISTGSISNLYREGLAYYRCCHEQAAAKLGELYREKGFILHLDGTNEGGEFTHFICRDFFTGHTVFSRMIRSENQEDVAKILRAVCKLFGRPIAVVSDLSPALRAAICEVFGEKFPHVLCQFHFLKDVGKDILNGEHVKLKALLKSSGVSRKLNAFRKKIKKLISSENQEKVLEDYEHILAMAEWVSDYRSELNAEGFPFDLSWISYYNRCLQKLENIRLIFADKNRTHREKSTKQLGLLMKILEGVEQTTGIDVCCQRLNGTRLLFEQLREVFHLKDDEKEDASPLNQQKPSSSGKEIRTKIDHFIKLLKEHESLPEKPTKLKRTLADHAGTIRQHLEKYKDGLSREIKIGDRIITSPRTNNTCELTFREAKRKARRTNGRKNLSKTMDHTPAEIFLLWNHTDESYRKIVFGDKLPHEAFAQIDRQLVLETLKDMGSLSRENRKKKVIKSKTFLQDTREHFLKTSA